MKKKSGLIGLALVAGCAAAPMPAPRQSVTTSNTIAIMLPGAPAGGVMMDYIAYDRANHRVWIPAGNTGSVDVIEANDGRVTRIDGFATAEVERKGKKRVVGPSSATVGDGFVYVGNRGDSSVCAIDAVALTRRGCITLDAMPDGLAFVASAREVWVTTPRNKSITILDATKAGLLSLKTKLTFDGEPEGFAVDDTRGIFYTNLEDKDRTLSIDIASRKTTRNWPSGCGEDGPKGIALDHAFNYVLVACSDRVKVLDANHDGKELSNVATGDGVDNIDYVEARHELFAGAGRASKLTVATLDAAGLLKVTFVVPTASGARNGVATDEGVTYLTDAAEGKILVVSPPTGH